MMSSMFIGASGLRTHSEGMSVITHNLSNVNTLGFKQQSFQFFDLVSQYMTVSSANLTGTSQKGMGAAPGVARTLFKQGGLEAGSATTDLCIEGQGFFGVTKDGQTNYTRAGNFRFNKEGELLDGSGWNVLGRPISGGVVGATAEPIVLDMSPTGASYMQPQATSFLTATSSLGGLTDNSTNEGNPFFAMAASWNANASPPIGSTKYSYGEPVQFYDTRGQLQNATIYYDLAGKSSGNTAVEYIMAMDPGADTSDLAGTRAAGLLMAGTVTFGSDGSMINMTAFTPPESGDPADLAGWTPAPVRDGRPVFAARPTDAITQRVALDMGFVYASSKDSGAGLASAAEAAANPDAIYGAAPGGTRTDKASVAYGTSPGSIASSKDGYAPGTLRDIEVTREGLVRGIYSNNQDKDLYQVSLYRFTSQDGLRHEGNNHFSATPESGAADEGFPTEENFGSIASSSLEQSNVDYSREFSLLIVTQRGFQMNSKVITTSDTMLQKALELKR